MSDNLPDSIVHVVARIRSLPEKTHEVSRILLDLVPPTRVEAGCLRYDLLVAEADPTLFVFIEEWQDQSALEAHSRSDHLATAGQLMAGLLASEPEVLNYRQIA